ncbi:MAG: Na/Pi cotransporter family protein [Clostridia bacterium]|nr:Na/Pi cotransporter family protein [Clostridia bacterium]
MDIYSIISLFGGLALFLYGMHTLSSGLEKMAGSKMEAVLKKVTSNSFKGLAFGTVVTAVVQSSSAVTVMLVSLVNSGIMQLRQTIGVIMGSNIGTTVTAWILSLMGIDSDNFFVNMLKPSNFSPIVAFIGIMLIMACKKQNLKDTGYIFIGFAVLMYGMTAMSGSVEALSEDPRFAGIFTLFDNPLMGVVVGLVFTAVIQSSSASVGVLQAISMTGAITYYSAIPIIMGQNIGTCISSLIACVGTSKNAKRVAAVHILFNCIGTVVFLAIWLAAISLFDLSFAHNAVAPYDIAVIHSVFNIISTVLMFPFSSGLEKLVKIIVPD